MYGTPAGDTRTAHAHATTLSEWNRRACKAAVCGVVTMQWLYMWKTSTCLVADTAYGGCCCFSHFSHIRSHRSLKTKTTHSHTGQFMANRTRRSNRRSVMCILCIQMLACIFAWTRIGIGNKMCELLLWRRFDKHIGSWKTRRQGPQSQFNRWVFLDFYISRGRKMCPSIYYVVPEMREY